jgi:hypothetical protein
LINTVTKTTESIRIFFRTQRQYSIMKMTQVSL